MAKRIVGAYQTEIEAINVVNGLELKGMKAKNITILTTKNAQELKNRTDVKVESNVPFVKNEASFIIKFKRALLKETDQELDFHEKLTNLGLSLEQVGKCITDIESGMVLVIADDELKMGHAPPINN